MKKLAVLSLVFSLSCAPLLQALPAIATGAQYVGRVIDIAEAGSDAYYARHPNPNESDVDAAIMRARSALAGLEALVALGEAADAGDVAAARQALLDAYSELRQLLAERGILSGTPPLGGAETDAPEPQPIAIPEPTEVAKRLPW